MFIDVRFHFRPFMSLQTQPKKYFCVPNLLLCLFRSLFLSVKLFIDTNKHFADYFRINAHHSLCWSDDFHTKSSSNLHKQFENSNHELNKKSFFLVLCGCKWQTDNRTLKSGEHINILIMILPHQTFSIFSLE